VKCCVYVVKSKQNASSILMISWQHKPQRRVVRTKFDIYVFITITESIPLDIVRVSAQTWFIGYISILSVPDEGYSRNVPDEGYPRNVPDEGYSRNVPDEGYSRNASCALKLISTFWLNLKCKLISYKFQVLIETYI